MQTVFNSVYVNKDDTTAGEVDKFIKAIIEKIKKGTEDGYDVCITVDDCMFIAYDNAALMQGLIHALEDYAEDIR